MIGNGDVRERFSLELIDGQPQAFSAFAFKLASTAGGKSIVIHFSSSPAHLHFQ
jgi:hypothetical protein